jgi:Phage tail tube protein, GTA-gp10
VADNLRNEVQIELGGTTYTMRATFGAIRAIEQELGNIVPLTAKLGGGDCGVNQAAVIVYNGLRGFGDQSMTLEQVGNAILAEGLNKVMAPIAQFVIKALEGVSLAKSGEPEAA